MCPTTPPTSTPNLPELFPVSLHLLQPVKIVLLHALAPASPAVSSQAGSPAVLSSNVGTEYFEDVKEDGGGGVLAALQSSPVPPQPSGVPTSVIVRRQPVESAKRGGEGADGGGGEKGGEGRLWCETVEWNHGEMMEKEDYRELIETDEHFRNYILNSIANMTIDEDFFSCEAT